MERIHRIIGLRPARRGVSSLAAPLVGGVGLATTALFAGIAAAEGQTDEPVVQQVVRGIGTTQYLVKPTDVGKVDLVQAMETLNFDETTTEIARRATKNGMEERVLLELLRDMGTDESMMTALETYRQPVRQQYLATIELVDPALDGELVHTIRLLQYMPTVVETVEGYDALLETTDGLTAATLPMVVGSLRQDASSPLAVTSVERLPATASLLSSRVRYGVAIPPTAAAPGGASPFALARTLPGAAPIDGTDPAALPEPVVIERLPADIKTAPGTPLGYGWSTVPPAPGFAVSPTAPTIARLRTTAPQPTALVRLDTTAPEDAQRIVLRGGVTLLSDGLTLTAEHVTLELNEVDLTTEHLGKILVEPIVTTTIEAVPALDLSIEVAPAPAAAPTPTAPATPAQPDKPSDAPAAEDAPATESYED